MRSPKTKHRAVKQSTKSKRPKPVAKHTPHKRKELLLAAANTLQELRAGPHPDGELSPGEAWLQQEQDKWDARYHSTPEKRAKFRWVVLRWRARFRNALVRKILSGSPSLHWGRLDAFDRHVTETRLGKGSGCRRSHGALVATGRSKRSSSGCSTS